MTKVTLARRGWQANGESQTRLPKASEWRKPHSLADFVLTVPAAPAPPGVGAHPPGKQGHRQVPSGDDEARVHRGVRVHRRSPLRQDRRQLERPAQQGERGVRIV